MLFYGEKEEFESITVSSMATAEDVVNDVDVQVQLDKAGINNRYICIERSIYILI